jgi:hypothetical protein
LDINEISVLSKAHNSGHRAFKIINEETEEFQKERI